MKRNKVHFYLVMFLATLSLISVGFASWVASEGMTTSTSGMIVVDDVMRYNEYITCSSGNITDFSYFGFVDSEGNISTTGTLVAQITIHKEKCNEEFKDCDTLEVNILLDSDSLGLLNDDENIKFTAAIYIVYKEQGKEDEKLTGVTPSINPEDDTTYELKFNLPIDQDSNDLILTLVYTFEIQEGKFDHYSKDVYPILKDENFNFAITAKLTGTKGVQN